MGGFNAIPSKVLSSAAVAYVHYLSFMVCFAALVVERWLIRPNPERKSTVVMVLTDVVYGVAGLSLLVSGIFRVLYFGQGTDFYTANPLFWCKVGTYLAVSALSLYPTITYIRWFFSLRRGEDLQVSDSVANRLRMTINIELLGFTLTPMLATLMARGVGLAG